MSDKQPTVAVTATPSATTIALSGAWTMGNALPTLASVVHDFDNKQNNHVLIDGSALTDWDSALMAWLLKFHNYCEENRMAVSAEQLPDGARALLQVATAVPPFEEPAAARKTLWQRINPAHLVLPAIDATLAFMAFIGAVTVALLRMLSGRANTRLSDFLGFVYQAGPNALGIISLISVLVGMILAYLGAVQLRQLGAEVYVADLVTIGALREMGVLMTAVVMAGRTGAAYAAQLGTMQTNEEIDAVTTLGISPIEFLVLPRMLALICVMPLLTLYADALSIVGGGLVAVGMGVSPIQYLSQAQLAVTAPHVAVGLIKAVVFGALIAIAGCRAGIQSGRSSAAVGQAATNAVVTSVVYLIVADAAINIFCQQIDF